MKRDSVSSSAEVTDVLLVLDSMVATVARVPCSHFTEHVANLAAALDALDEWRNEPTCVPDDGESSEGDQYAQYRTACLKHAAKSFLSIFYTLKSEVDCDLRLSELISKAAFLSNNGEKLENGDSQW